MIRIYNATQQEKKIIRMVSKYTFKHFAQKDIFIIEINIVQPNEIKEINNTERGIDSITDVLSFPAQNLNGKFPIEVSSFDIGEKENGKVILGTICICRKKAEEQALEYGHSLEREVGFLTVHGLLHLLGFDHINTDDEKVMREHQREILNSADLGVNI